MAAGCASLAAPWPWCITALSVRLSAPCRALSACLFFLRLRAPCLRSRSAPLLQAAVCCALLCATARLAGARRARAARPAPPPRARPQWPQTQRRNRNHTPKQGARNKTCATVPGPGPRHRSNTTLNISRLLASRPQRPPARATIKGPSSAWSIWREGEGASASTERSSEHQKKKEQGAMHTQNK
jgi:hypothetical protein